MAGVDHAALIDHVPDEFYSWVKDTVASLRGQYAAIERQASAEFKAAPKETRKDFALAVARSPLRSILFQMLDGRDYAQTIWRMLRPCTEPFKTDEL